MVYFKIFNCEVNVKKIIILLLSLLPLITASHTICMKRKLKTKKNRRLHKKKFRRNKKKKSKFPPNTFKSWKSKKRRRSWKDESFRKRNIFTDFVDVFNISKHPIDVI